MYLGRDLSRTAPSIELPEVQNWEVVFIQVLRNYFLTTDTALAFGASVNTDGWDLKDSRVPKRPD